MQHKIFLFILISASYSCFFAQTTLIPDPNFEQALIDLGIDSDGTLNGQVLTADINTIVSLNVMGQNIDDLTGIENFSDLEILNCNGNSIHNLDLTQNSKLVRLEADYNEIVAIDLSQNVFLEVIRLNDNELISFDASENSALKELYLGNEEEDVFPFNELATLDLSENTALEIVDCYFIRTLESINLTGLTSLKTLELSACNLTNLELITNSDLEELSVGYFDPDFTTFSNNLTSLDLRSNTKLTSFFGRNTTLEVINAASGQNDIVTFFVVTDSPSLECVQVDDVAAANASIPPYNNWFIDSNAMYSSEECTLSLDDLSTIEIQTYPNPVQNQFNVSGSSATEVDRIVLYDMQGKEVRTVLGGTILDMRELPSGLYFAKISIGTYTLSRKLLKQ